MAADALNVFIGSTSDDPRKLDKTITWLVQSGTTTPFEFKCYITGNCDILNPTLVLAYDSNVVGSNYANIPSWGNRYYFITSIQVIPGGKMMLSLSVDVLKTYETAIKECYCCVTRSESAEVNWVTDTCYPINPNEKYIPPSTLFNFSGFTTGQDTYFVDIAEFKQYTFELPELPD